MCPNELFLGMTLYDIMFTLGVLSALVTFRLLCDRTEISPSLFNFCLGNAAVTVVGAIGTSIVFQAFYNWLGGGEFRLDASTGMTFFGGLIGGAAIFLAVYFGVGHFFFRDGRHIRCIKNIADNAACGIVIAHALGRIGCFFAGCCHGRPTDGPLGIYMQYAGERVIPIQLFEALFLLALFAFLLIRRLKGKGDIMSSYLMGYGMWRFFAEYLRGDDRGATLVDFLSPSQLTALLLILGGAVLFCLQNRRKKEAADE